MKFEKIGSRRKAELVQRICSYLKLPLVQMFDSDRLNPDADFCVGPMRFNSADSFLFGTVSSVYDEFAWHGLWSLEQHAELGLSMPRHSRDLFDRLDFSSVSALEVQLSVFGY